MDAPGWGVLSKRWHMASSHKALHGLWALKRSSISKSYLLSSVLQIMDMNFLQGDGPIFPKLFGKVPLGLLVRNHDLTTIVKTGSPGLAMETFGLVHWCIWFTVRVLNEWNPLFVDFWSCHCLEWGTARDICSVMLDQLPRESYRWKLSMSIRNLQHIWCLCIYTFQSTVPLCELNM